MGLGQRLLSAASRLGKNVLRLTALLAVAVLAQACTAGVELDQANLNGASDQKTGSIDAGHRAANHPKWDLALAQAHFKRGAYGLSEKHFRLAIEHDRKNAEAWLGLAASYDQLRRFDLADRAYDRVRELLGDDAVVLNNLGYSQTLRGNYAKAAVLLARARKKDPGDERILQNIEFLDKRRLAAGQ